MIGQSRIYEMWHDMTPNMMLLDVIVSSKKQKEKKEYNKYLILIRLT